MPAGTGGAPTVPLAGPNDLWKQAMLDSYSGLYDLAVSDFQERRNRRFQIADERSPHDLRLAGRIARGERRSRRLDLHI